MTFFKKISIKLKFAIFIIGSIITALLFFYINNNLKLKKQMEFELTRVKKESELISLEKDSKVKQQKLNDLKKEEKLISDKIAFIENKEIKGEEVSIEELEDFFANRGF